MSETRDNCYYYNYGGDSSFHGDRPPYPKIYGARCEFYEKFFSSKRQIAQGEHEELKPDCDKCQEYRNKPRAKNDEH